jgi:alanine racemase
MPYLLDNKLPRISWENALRPGCYVFGPFSYSNEKDDSFNAIQLVSKVVQINNAKIGETVGYESTYAIKKNNELIANIAIG